MLYDSKRWEGPTPYLPAEALGVSNKVREAFIAVHEAMLSDELPKMMFTMAHVGRPSWTRRECGTPGCILGWAQAYLRATRSRAQVNATEQGNSQLHELIYPVNYLDAVWCTDQKVACVALGNWLTTGDARWSEVVEEKSNVV